MASKFSPVLKTVHMRQLETRLFYLNTCGEKKKNVINSNERVLLIRGCLLLICKGSDSLSAVWKPSSYRIKGKRFLVGSAYRKSLNTHHHLWLRPALCTSALLQQAMALVNALRPPPARPPLAAAFPAPCNQLYLSVQFYSLFLQG